MINAFIPNLRGFVFTFILNLFNFFPFICKALVVMFVATIFFIMAWAIGFNFFALVCTITNLVRFSTLL